MKRFLLCALLFNLVQVSRAQEIDSALRRINNYLKLQQEQSPFFNGADSIDVLNLQIQQGLLKWLNHSSFQPETHFSLLSDFSLSNSPDKKVVTVGWYLNNGGTWQMQYSGLFIRNSGSNLFIPDTDALLGDKSENPEAIFQPLSGGEVQLISTLQGLPAHYVYHIRTKYCGTCISERIGFFRLDSAGNPVPAYLIDDGNDKVVAEYRYDSEGLRFDTTTNRIYLELHRDDLSEEWFNLANTNNRLKASWILREGNFRKEHFQYSRWEH